MEHSGNTAQTDAWAVRQVLGGNTQAFGILVKRYESALFAFLGRHLPHSDVAEAAQDSFMQAFEKLSQLREPEAFKSWLYAIAHRRCIRQWRTSQVRREVAMDTSVEDQSAWMEELLAADSRQRHEDLCRQQEASALVKRLMAGLKPDDQVAIGLFYAKEHDMAEIAAIMGWSVEKVKVRLHRARKSMAQSLEQLSREEARI